MCTLLFVLQWRQFVGARFFFAPEAVVPYCRTLVANAVMWLERGMVLEVTNTAELLAFACILGFLHRLSFALGRRRLHAGQHRFTLIRCALAAAFMFATELAVLFWWGDPSTRRSDFQGRTKFSARFAVATLSHARHHWAGRSHALILTSVPVPRRIAPTSGLCYSRYAKLFATV